MEVNMNLLKIKALDAITKQRNGIISIGEEIFRHPELGYKEHNTSTLVKQVWENLGLENITGVGFTGWKGYLKEKESKTNTKTDKNYEDAKNLKNNTNSPITIAIMGELDAVISPKHPFADKDTGAAHACGHHAQIAAMIGCAIGLSAVKDALDGNVCFLATPAEEYIELGYRSQLKKDGHITYYGGKQQMIAEGVFDDIDMALMVHSETNQSSPHISINSHSTGFIGKNIRFLGKEAHAGGAPWDGVNALNAATLAISAIHAQRETFRDCDSVRVHPIITKGGDLVNTVPSEVIMDSYVRAASIEAMKAANAKVNRAIKGASYAIGTNVQIIDSAGYLPLMQNPSLSKLFSDNAAGLLPNVTVEENLPFCGSTDAGDLSYLIPVIQPTISGFSGDLHSCDFKVDDEELAYLVPAKLMAMTVIDLLTNNALIAKEIRKTSPRREKEDYILLWDTLLQE